MSNDYTSQISNSNTKTILFLKYPTSRTALISVYVNTDVHGVLSSENLVLTTFWVRWEEGLQKYESANPREMQLLMT